MDRGNNVVELRNVAIYHGDDASRRGAGAEGELVLSDVNLSVAAGETVYFIGVWAAARVRCSRPCMPRYRCLRARGVWPEWICGVCVAVTYRICGAVWV